MATTMKPRTFRMTQEEYEDATEGYEGRCLACGAVHGECEPDARRYPCDECEAEQVYGVEELLMMGRVLIVDDLEDDDEDGEDDE